MIKGGRLLYQWLRKFVAVCVCIYWSVTLLKSFNYPLLPILKVCCNILVGFIDNELLTDPAPIYVIYYTLYI